MHKVDILNFGGKFQNPPKKTTTYMKKQYMKPEAAMMTVEANAILSDSKTLEKGKTQQDPQEEPEWPNSPDDNNRLWAE